MGARLIRQRGFTLIEVLVASSILALTMIGVLVAASDTFRSSQHLKDRTLALWVANNIAVEIRNEQHGEITPTAVFQGQYLMGQTQWYWQARVKNIPPGVNTFIIDVAPSQTDNPVVTLESA